jgi:hypothetical protein
LSHKDARVHCVVLNVRAAPHLAVDAFRQRRGFVVWWGPRRPQAGSRRSRFRPSPQDPTTCQAPTRCVRPFHGPRACTRTTHVASAPTNRCSTLEHLS